MTNGSSPIIPSVHPHLTSVWRIGSEPSAIEDAMITERRSLLERLRRIGAQRLLDKGINWEKITRTGDKWTPGAVSPSLARETLTRQAIRRKELRRKALRSGASGLSAALL